MNLLDASLASLQRAEQANRYDDELASLFAGLSTFEDAVYTLATDLARTLVRKHADYGPLNISRSPGGALNGLRVRMHDKLARINHLHDTGAEPENEPLRDSLLDLAGYALIGLLVLDGEWPSE